MAILEKIWFAINAIKRESGENPEQTRCCKFRHFSVCMPLTKQECDGWEGDAERNKSEDLPILLIRTYCARG